MARPRKQDPEELRRAIVVAAVEMLRDQHVDGISARGLAARLGISPTAIYRIFPTMADVLMEVNRGTFGDLDRIFENLPDGASAAERLFFTGRSYMQFMQANPNLWRALFEGQRDSSAYPEWYGAAVAALIGRLATLLRAAGPALDDATAMDQAGRLYVLAHGAIALQFDGRLGLITATAAQDLIEDAIRQMIIRWQG